MPEGAVSLAKRGPHSPPKWMETSMTQPELIYGNQDKELPCGPSLGWNVPPRTLDDRIRQLCARVIATREKDLGPAISDLRAALHEHTQRLRRLAVGKLIFRWSPEQRPF